MFIHKYWFHQLKLAKLYIKHDLFHRFHKFPSIHKKNILKTIHASKKQTLKPE